MELTKENLKISTVKEEKGIGIYSFEPLPTGFGYTLANALRRVLMTSIKGAAATQVKINGANHQFTTMPGVKEDVVELTLNLKKIRFKNHSEGPVIVTIDKKGPGKVTAKDIEAPSDVEIMNKDQHIATLADAKSKFEAEITVEPGVGYSPMEERQTSKLGVIVLDALFSPVLSANYEIEPARFGGRTDLDKIIFTIETDGSISPKQALINAAQILKDYYVAFEEWKEGTATEEKKEEKTRETKLTEDVSVEELPLQTRTINALKKSKINTLHELAQKSDEDLEDIKNIGEKSLDEIKELLAKEGFRK
ncbi:DNA-directed RNA polymerase subunit alpha [candidate division WWE3 bacterium]|uniref:DNA-directed RNA polymerase subunit alpha n=1 Tax=candidate division WWE3 bacterium TaxID=2053526 RepID=A0A7X9E6I0_UNCKA|nr:DNA-directed RNA polymerase subunit alpha [candidate division WWE3 bacterium]